MKRGGAFALCVRCSSVPRTDDELASSLAFTDHNFDEPGLAQIGARIKAGAPPQLTPDLLAYLAPGVCEAKRMLGLGRREPVAAPAHLKPRTKSGMVALAAGVAATALALALIGHWWS
jgi:hypothetical protein